MLHCRRFVDQLLLDGPIGWLAFSIDPMRWHRSEGPPECRGAPLRRDRAVQALPDGDTAERHQYADDWLAGLLIDNGLPDQRFKSGIDHPEELIEFRNAVAIVAGSDQPE